MLSIGSPRPLFDIPAGIAYFDTAYNSPLRNRSRTALARASLEETWLARNNAADFTALVDYSDTYLPGARRFDVGEKCTAILPGAIAALEQLHAWGVSNVARVLGQINDRIASRLEALGFALPPSAQRCPHMIGAQLPQGVASDVVGCLRAQHVFISQRGSSVRVAPHLHVTEADVEQLFAALDVAVASSMPWRRL